MKKMMAVCATIFLIVLFIPLTSYALCVNVPLANLRSGPGEKYKTVWQVYKFMPLQILSSSGNWYRVKDIDGYTEYVYKPLATSRYRCAAI
ncbi:MAG: SH3 domain-containing protein, partial [Nitrospiraceae bacterium]|nr:SH3 domain-containing protein [Nitrospiraceae bacterium]